MKTLITLLLVTLSSQLLAESPVDYELCTARDRSLLQAATVRGNSAVIELIKNDVIENEVSCMVSRPMLAHPAVCGFFVTQIDTFIINTKTKGTYSVVVDSSYSNCTRMRVIPMVKYLTFSPTIEPTYFP